MPDPVPTATAPARTLPVPDPDSAPYWAALAEGRFLMQQCRECGRWTWPVRPICSGCHGDELDWVEPSGTGEVVSWVITHQAYAPDLAALVPYPIVLVRVDEQDDILIPGRFVSHGSDGSDGSGVSDVEIRPGLRVRAAPEPVTAEVGLLNWEAATDGE